MAKRQRGDIELAEIRDSGRDRVASSRQFARSNVNRLCYPCEADLRAFGQGPVTKRFHI